VSYRADEYHRLARECLALAADPRIAEDIRQALMGTARDWTRRAAQAEAAAHASPPLAAEAPQPVMQQQQQVQPKPDKPGDGG
jgi:hypothetical protein